MSLTVAVVYLQLPYIEAQGPLPEVLRKAMVSFENVSFVVVYLVICGFVDTKPACYVFIKVNLY